MQVKEIESIKRDVRNSYFKAVRDNDLEKQRNLIPILKHVR